MAVQEPPENNSTEATTPELPAKIRVHALAKLLGLTSKEIIAKAADLGTELRSAHSTLHREAAAELYTALSGPPAETPSGAAAVPEPSADDLATAVEETTAVSGDSTTAVSGDSTTAVSGDSTTAAPTVAPAPVGGPTGLFAAPGAETPLFDSPQVDTPPALATAPAAATEPAVAAPLFLPPTVPTTAEEEGATRPRRRRSRRGAAEPVSAEAGTEDTVAAEAPAAETPGSDGPVADEAGADATAEDRADTPSEDDEHPRRRRRGRRGRGRGRGEHIETTPDASADAASDDEDESGRDTRGGAEAEDAQAESGADTADAASEQAAGTGEDTAGAEGTAEASEDDAQGDGTSRRRRRRRRRRGSGEATDTAADDDPPNTVVHEREPRTKARTAKDEVQGISGSTRLEAKRQRRRDGREAGRRRPPILTESEFLARREAVERVMVVRERTAGTHAGMTQVAVLEDGILVEHFVTSAGSASMVGNIYLGRVQNVLPSMEAAFIDIGRGRNGVLYAGEVNWEAAGLGGNSRKIEQALKPGDQVVVQVSKDPVGHKGARLTTQISLAGRFLVYVPGGSSTGISRKLPDTERKRLKDVLREIVPADAGVIIRTAAEGVSEDELARDVARLQSQWEAVRAQADKEQENASGQPRTLYEEPDLLVKVVRDLFNEDFSKLVIEGDKSWSTVENYIRTVAPDLLPRVERYRSESSVDVFGAHRIDEQLAKALDRKVWLPSGGTLVIDRTEAMTVIDVNTGKFTGSGGNLEETVTRNNLEAAEEIVRQMRLRDIGGMIVVDFIDMVLESNRDLVLRRLTEALGRDRTRHQVSEVTSLGLVQMTRKRLGTGLVEAFSTTCEHCHGRGLVVHADPVDSKQSDDSGRAASGSRRKRGRDKSAPEATAPAEPTAAPAVSVSPEEAAKRAAHPVALAMAAHRSDSEHDDRPEPGATGEPAAEPVPDGSAAPEKVAPEKAAPTEVVATTEPAEVVATTEPAEVVAATEPAEVVAATEPAEVVATEPAESAEPAREAAATEPETESAPPSEQGEDKPRRRRARRVSRATAAPTGAAEVATRVFVIPTPVEPEEAVPAASGPAESSSDGETPVEIVRRPRRRRAAGRPAGPPVDAPM